MISTPIWENNGGTIFFFSFFKLEEVSWIIRKGEKMWIKIGMEWIHKDWRRMDGVLKSKNFDR